MIIIARSIFIRFALRFIVCIIVYRRVIPILFLQFSQISSSLNYVWISVSVELSSLLFSRSDSVTVEIKTDLHDSKNGFSRHVGYCQWNDSGLVDTTDFNFFPTIRILWFLCHVGVKVMRTHPWQICGSLFSQLLFNKFQGNLAGI